MGESVSDRRILPQRNVRISNMCVVIPGKVIALEDGLATVDFSGNQVKAFVGLVNTNVGDYVLVHAGCVIQTMKQQEAEEILELMDGFKE